MQKRRPDGKRGRRQRDHVAEQQHAAERHPTECASASRADTQQKTAADEQLPAGQQHGITAGRVNARDKRARARRDRAQQHQTVTGEVEAVQSAQSEREHARKAADAAKRFPSIELIIRQQAMRQQQREKRLRAGEHRAFGAGRAA